MNSSVEHRLRELFDTIETQVAPQPMSGAPNQRRHRVPRSLVVARVALVGVAVAAAVALMVSSRHRAPGVDVAAVPPITIDARSFNDRVDDFCHTLEVERNGVEPQFATTEAYVTVVEARRDAIATFVEALSGLARPGDAPDLPASVIARFRAVRDLLDDVEQAARAGRLDDAAAVWRQVDARIDATISPLGTHGAPNCSPQGD